MTSNKYRYHRCLLFILVVLAVSSLRVDACSSNDTEPGQEVHQRQKRFLTFLPWGGVVKAVFSFVAPVKFQHRVKRSVNLAINCQANYPVPAKIIYPIPESYFKNRDFGDSNFMDNSRVQLYQLLEKMIGSWSPNGRACLLRTICEVADTPLKHNGLIGELLDIIFT
ncbi:uncharacterized protein LOC131680737 [Topomyia yanbarensis]|uniref:uncharacterized protein LOC131680737 n=1 Tax=Topomyia yanbarensis TaxID=2498891 RepID=UPI00273AE31C|nr:uncharacterized protein LOC131680737 [Topomyia yanbarensis]